MKTKDFIIWSGSSIVASSLVSLFGVPFMFLLAALASERELPLILLYNLIVETILLLVLKSRRQNIPNVFAMMLANILVWGGLLYISLKYDGNFSEMPFTTLITDYLDDWKLIKFVAVYAIWVSIALILEYVISIPISIFVPSGNKLVGTVISLIFFTAFVFAVGSDVELEEKLSQGPKVFNMEDIGMCITVEKVSDTYMTLQVACKDTPGNPTIFSVNPTECRAPYFEIENGKLLDYYSELTIIKIGACEVFQEVEPCKKIPMGKRRSVQIFTKPVRFNSKVVVE